MRSWRLSRGQALRLVGLALALVLLALVLSGCETDTPQNTFAAEGEVAREQRDIFYYAMWPAIAILILVEAAIVIALLKFRRRGNEMPRQIHGNTRLEIAWTIAPALILAVLAVPMIDTIFKLGEEPPEDAFTINVTGVQWQWIFEYPDITDASGKPLTAVREFHFPAGEEIRFNITAKDVIHSFWIPRLAGKLDAIPGRTNRMWLKADEPGSYSGQCAEFCGLNHADMKLIAHADSPEDFQAWVNEMQQ